MRRPMLVFAALVAAVGIAAARPDAAYADNTAIAINTKDGSSVFKLAWSIKKVAGDVVDETNAAVSYASCESCQTVTIAIQIVFVVGDPEVVTPTNLAIALNEECTSCETLASAYQFVLGTDVSVHFTPEGRRRLNEIRRALRELEGSNLSIEEIQARVDALMDELADVLRNELVMTRRGEGEPGGDDETGTRQTTTTQPAGTTTQSTTGPSGTTTAPSTETSTPATTTGTATTTTTTAPTTTTTTQTATAPATSTDTTTTTP